MKSLKIAFLLGGMYLAFVVAVVVIDKRSYAAASLPVILFIVFLTEFIADNIKSRSGDRL